jgi:S1-C subfamily serine protease
MGFGGATGYGNGGPDDENDDGHDDEPRDRPRSSLPDPLDRVWLHPSELSPVAATTVARTKPMWTTTLLAGAAGAVLTLIVLGAMGAIGGSSDNTTARAVPTSVPIMTTQALAVAVAHSIVAVSAHDGDGTKRRGSGVCVRVTGEILTSDRLVGAADKVTVTTADGVVHPARVVGRDTSTDLLLLSLASDAPRGTNPGASKQAANSLGVPATASLVGPNAGDTVWVVGAPTPGDTSPWVSSGLLASTDSLVADSDGPITSGLLETAAASNKSSSGGALVDRAGNVTGIILAPVGDNRMTYAVPIATALSVAHDFRARGFTTHGALGINGVNGPDGPTVTLAIKGGPAALAGMRAGDVVETIGRYTVDSMSDLVALVRHYRPGDVVKVEVQRGSKTLWVSARLTSMTS